MMNNITKEQMNEYEEANSSLEWELREEARKTGWMNEKKLYNYLNKA